MPRPSSPGATLVRAAGLRWHTGPDDVESHFGWGATFFSMDLTATAAQLRHGLSCHATRYPSVHAPPAPLVYPDHSYRRVG